MQFMLSPYHLDILLALSSTNSKLHIISLTGGLTMIFSLAVTSTLTFSECSYDLFLYNGSNTFRAIEGKITVKEVITV